MKHGTACPNAGGTPLLLDSARSGSAVDPVRRKLLLGIGAGATSLILPSYADAATARAAGFERIRTLKLYRKATGESAYFAYWKDGQLDQAGYRYANYLLRDVQARKTVPMSPALLDVMAWVQAYLRAYGWDLPIVINSGYRSPATNDNTEGAAKKSLHMRALAVDMAIPNIPASYLGQLLRRLGQGGVGTYQARGFVHLDVGNVRSWKG